jgi:uncharacterized protein YabN with tetrapyrrole methylase and pyrophosphatase domain
VAREINDKLVRRHPHVFGTGKLDNLRAGDCEVGGGSRRPRRRTARRRDRGGVFKELPPRLPALMFAEAVWKQIEKKALPADGVVDTAQVRRWPNSSTARPLLGRKMLFELTAAARVTRARSRGGAAVARHRR